MAHVVDGATGYGGMSFFAFAIVIYVLLVIVLDVRWWGV
ncbi:MAG: sporulation protein YjcZ [Hydrogenibacillus schlegelii]|uniref:Sporulation protein YjcZ n=1 Tax=Hydrogenibacillus schlegelii TaxID=1484 RepID=A0A947GAF0_HYDSH|nr:sporulation protein YjcZ [Hydrogenibacillus schlegelii]